MNARVGAALAVVAFLASPRELVAVTVASMNLAELTQRADTIVRGTVSHVIHGSARIGGRDASTTTYRIRVTDLFKGHAKEVKGIRYVDVRMFSGFGTAQRHIVPLRAGIQSLTLTQGDEYLLFITKPSAAGLSTTVGLGQGKYRIARVGRREQAVNDLNNAMLFRGMDAGGLPGNGPMPYEAIADRVRRLVASAGK